MITLRNVRVKVRLPIVLLDIQVYCTVPALWHMMEKPAKVRVRNERKN